MKGRILAAVAVAVAGVVPSVIDASTASAASTAVGNYPAFAHEGRYPAGNHACAGNGWTKAAGPKSGKWDGRTYTIRLCFKPGIGAYARLDGAAINDSHCYVVLDRSNKPNEVRNYASVWESVDSNVGYAYTKVGSNLAGRYARAALVCQNKGQPYATAVVRTRWFGVNSKPHGGGGGLAPWPGPTCKNVPPGGTCPWV